MRLEQTLHKRLPVILGGGLAVIGLNLALYFTAVSKLDRFTRSVKASVSENRAKLAESKRKDKAVTKSVEHVKNNRQVVADLTGKLLLTKGQRLVEVQKEIMALAEARHLQLDSLNYNYTVYPQDRRAALGRTFLRLEVNVPVTGPYQEIKGFIRDVQASPQFLTLSSVNLTASTQGSVLIQGNLAVTTYFVATAQDLKDAEPRGGKRT